MEIEQWRAQAAEQQKQIEELQQQLLEVQAAAKENEAAIDNYNLLLQNLLELGTLEGKDFLIPNEIARMDELNQAIENLKGILPENLYAAAQVEADKTKKENERYKKDKILEAAYDTMLDNMIKLWDLEGVNPVSDEDRDYFDEEREKLEEEIKRAKEILPVEFQQVIQEGVEHVMNQQQPRRSQPTPHNNLQTEKRTLDQIMYELLEGLSIGENSGNQLIASRIKFGREFKQRIRAGGLFSVISNAASAVKSGFKKVAGKFSLWATKQQSTVEILEDRINDLSDNDIITILEEYLGDAVKKGAYPSTLNILLNARAQSFLMDKIEDINKEISKTYSQLREAVAIVAIYNAKLADSQINEDERASYEAAKQEVLNGKAEQIGELRELYNKANQCTLWADGFSKEMKTTHRHPFSFGKRTYDSEKQRKKAALSGQESKAVEEGNNEDALNAFAALESLKAGEPNYSPLVGAQGEQVERIIDLVEDYKNATGQEAAQRTSRR